MSISRDTRSNKEWKGNSKQLRMKLLKYTVDNVILLDTSNFSLVILYCLGRAMECRMGCSLYLLLTCLAKYM